jgi:hypothetical protein
VSISYVCTAAIKTARNCVKLLGLGLNPWCPCIRAQLWTLSGEYSGNILSSAHRREPSKACGKSGLPAEPEFGKTEPEWFFEFDLKCSDGNETQAVVSVLECMASP